MKMLKILAVFLVVLVLAAGPAMAAEPQAPDRLPGVGRQYR